MIEEVLNRIQRAMIERESEARRRGDGKGAMIWASAQELVQEEKRRTFGKPRGMTEASA